jgi:hypothetical protein
MNKCMIYAAILLDYPLKPVCVCLGRLLTIQWLAHSKHADISCRENIISADMQPAKSCYNNCESCSALPFLFHFKKGWFLMFDAWNLSSIEFFYLTCAVVGGLLFILRAILFAFGGGGDADTDFDMNGDFDLDGSVDHIGEPGMRLVSLQGITGFFLMFGLVGLAMSRGGIREIYTIFGGTAAGIVTMLAIAKVILEMQKLQSSGTMLMSNAIGKEGRVYLTIPENGSGKVSIVIQGGLRELEAVSAASERISTGEMVRVVKVVSNRVLVVERAK